MEKSEKQKFEAISFREGTHVLAFASWEFSYTVTSFSLVLAHSCT